MAALRAAAPLRFASTAAIRIPTVHAAYARPAAVLYSREARRGFTSSFPLRKAAWDTGSIVQYDELKRYTKMPSDEVLLVDVREPDEVALGSIPSAVNLPLSTFEQSLSLDEGDFVKKNGFHMPKKDQQIIFYCRSGKRSTTATDLAKKRGYKAVRNYEGSYLDWQEKDKKNDD